ncbi:MAG: hypothetical protein E7441_10570 [Ruminococcaceae bacterium]|nr:hypothetical protein [Oscillospiraceae bacterium]
MKKFLSMVLTLALVLSLIPAVFAAGESVVTYSFYSTTSIVENGSLENVKGDGWAYAAASESGVLDTSGQIRISKGRIRVFAKANSNNWIAFKLDVPVTGNYDVSMNASLASSSTVEKGKTNKIQAFMFKAGDAIGDTEKAKVQSGVNNGNLLESENLVTQSDYLTRNLGTKYFEQGEYYFVFRPYADYETTKMYIYLNSLTLTKSTTPADEVDTVQFMATSTLKNNAGVTTNVSGYAAGTTTSDIALGRTVEVTASDVPGYIFRGWMRGSKDNGVWVSTSSTYSFPLHTNTYLTAVYDVDTATDADVNVEFYNYNGQFLKSKVVDGAEFGTLAGDVRPTLTGYNTYFWTLDGENAIATETVFEKLTRVVAKFTGTDSFAVTVPENVTSDKESGEYAYDTEITMTADNVGLWKVNGKPVAHGTSYTYTVWSEATITFEEKTESGNKPIISIDPNTTDGARMISYDANGKNIVEAGILFGDGATINAADSRAVSREAKGKVSGQFTAKSYDGTNTARGYIIYNDDLNSTYRVIYAD